MNLLTKLKSLYPDITPTEQSIADYILSKPEEIYRISIQELARKTHVSLPSVHRFARKLGFNGFKDFKINLIRDIGVSFHISPDGLEDGSIERIAKIIFEKEINTLKETLANISYAELEKAVEAITGSRRLLFFAVSSSLSVAFDFYLKFMRAGLNCFYNSDIYTQKIISTQCRKSDVAIGISFSGESPEVIDCLKNARGSGAKTICVTTFIESSIVRNADVKLLTAPVMSLYQKIDLPSKMSQTAIMDVIYLLVVLKNKENASKFISKSEEELLRNRRYKKPLSATTTKRKYA
jgi:DNA-binding MurR/RpiR family transcriptional regulator